MGLHRLTNFLKEIDFFCDYLSVRSSRKPRSLKQSSMLHLKSIYFDELDLQAVTKTEQICVPVIPCSLMPPILCWGWIDAKYEHFYNGEQR